MTVLAIINRIGEEEVLLNSRLQIVSMTRKVTVVNKMT